MDSIQNLLDCGFTLVKIRKVKLLDEESGKQTKIPLERWAHTGFQTSCIEGLQKECIAIKLGFQEAHQKFLAVIDIDNKTQERLGEKSFAELEAKLGKFPETVTAATEGGGIHYYFFTSEDLPKKIGIVPGIDLLTRELAYAPPSQFTDAQTGDLCNPYRWIKEPCALEQDFGIVTLPEVWLTWIKETIGERRKRQETRNAAHALPVVTPKELKEIERQLDAIASVSEENIYKAASNDWRTQWVKIGMALQSTELEEAFDLFLDFSRKTPKYRSDKDCERIWQSFNSEGNSTGRIGIFEIKLFAEKCYRVERGLSAELTMQERESMADVIKMNDFKEAKKEAIRVEKEAKKSQKPKKPLQKEIEETIRSLDIQGIDSMRFNIIKDTIEFGDKAAEDTGINKVISACRDYHVKGGHRDYENATLINRILELMAREKPFDAIEHYFDTCKKKFAQCDNKEHIKPLVDYINCGDENFELFFRKWLYGVVEKYRNGFQNRVLILKGREWTGKGTFSRALFKNIAPYYHQRKITLSDKDSFLMLPKFLCWDFEEFICSVKEINPLKAFITNEYITERKPYGVREKKQRVICSFMGSTNENDFLKDLTSSRRFFIVSFNPENASEKMEWLEDNFDPDLLWGEVLHRVDTFNAEKALGMHEKVKSIAWLNDEEIALTRKVNEEHREKSSIEELLCDSYEAGEAEDYITNDQVRDLLKANFFFHGFGEAKRILRAIAGKKYYSTVKKDKGVPRRVNYGIKKI